jgi:hypothetical protein
MDIFSYDILVLLLFLFTINFVCLVLVRSNERFWLPSSILWILLLCSLFINLTINKNNVIQKESEFNAQTDIESRSNETAILALEAAKKQETSENMILLRLAGFQTLMCLVLQLLGYKLTSLIQFKQGARAFIILLLLYGAIEMVSSELI